MRKIINITMFLFFSSLGAGYCADVSFSAELTPTEITSDNPLASENDSTGPRPHGSHSGTFWEKLTFFRENIKTDPVASQTTFIELYTEMPEQRRQMFLSRNYTRIADLLIELRKKDPSQYDDFVKFLATQGIGITQPSEDPSQTGPGNSRRMPPPRPIDNNPVNKLVEIKTDLQNGNPQTAAKKIENLSVEYSSSAPVQTAVAEFFSEVKNFQKSEDYSTKAIEIDDQNTDAYKIRAVSRYSMNDVKGAIEDIKKASEIEPQDETNRLLIALIESKKELKSKDLSSLKSLKDALGDQKDDSAIPIGSPGASINNSDSNSNVDFAKSKLYLKTAAAKNQMQDYDVALKYANMAIEKNPDNIEAYLERANSNNFLGNYDEAIKDLSFVINKQPSNVMALNMRSWAMYKKGVFDKADQDASSALKIKPDYADAMFSRSLAYEKQGKYEEMLSDLKNAAEISPLYRNRFQDAVSQYSDKAPNFAANYQNTKFNSIKSESENQDSAEKDKKIKKFLTILLFTITGGLLIGLGFMHIFSSNKNPSQSRITHPDVLSPSVFYEGVATGKYKIVGKIGQGGMGAVYKAVDQTLNREVAIKKMNDEIRMNEREKQRFLQEARLVAMLHHPNIIEIFTIFEEGEDIYLVFEYIDGETLDKKLDKDIRIPFYQVKDIVNEIGKALSYAHKKNIIHRDMKLSNVMISKDNYVKVMDFGLAKIAREALSRISSTEIVGSPAYMAPEQDKGIFLKESDIYSLGVCIYEMLAGELPFNGPDYHYQKENKMYTPISSSVPGLEADFDKIMDKLLAPDPQNRYKSIDDFLDDLNKIR